MDQRHRDTNRPGQHEHQGNGRHDHDHVREHVGGGNEPMRPQERYSPRPQAQPSYGGSGMGQRREPRGGVFGQRRPRYLPRDASGQQRSSAGGWIIGLILLVLIGLALWYFLTRTDQGSTVVPSAVPTVTISVPG
jgi:hypothetical protein